MRYQQLLLDDTEPAACTDPLCVTAVTHCYGKVRARVCTSVRARARSVIFRVVLVAGGSRAALGRQLTVAPRRWGQIWPCLPPRRVRTSAAPSQRGFQVAQSQYLHHHHHYHHRHHHHHHGGSRRISGSRPAAAAAADHQLANYQGVVRAAGSHRLVLDGGGSGLRVIGGGGARRGPVHQLGDDDEGPTGFLMCCRLLRCFAMRMLGSTFYRLPVCCRISRVSPVRRV